MVDELEKYRCLNLMTCDKLLLELKLSQRDIDRMFRGDINKVYTDVNERACESMHQIKNKIRKL